MKQHRRRFETVTYGTVEIAVCVDGSGAPLVVLPSFGRDGLDDFDLFTDLMTASGWRVLRPQPRRIAGSVGPMSAVDLQDLARDVAHVVRALTGGPVVLLGHAFGNFLARVVAVEDPDLVRGVVLAAASARKVAPDVNETPFIAGDPGRPEQERLDALTKAFFAPDTIRGRGSTDGTRRRWPCSAPRSRRPMSRAIGIAVRRRCWRSSRSSIRSNPRNPGGNSPEGGGAGVDDRRRRRRAGRAGGSASPGPDRGGGRGGRGLDRRRRPRHRRRLTLGEVADSVARGDGPASLAPGGVIGILGGGQLGRLGAGFSIDRDRQALASPEGMATPTRLGGGKVTASALVDSSGD